MTTKTPLKAVSEFHALASRYDWNRAPDTMRAITAHSVSLPRPNVPSAGLDFCLDQRASCRVFDPETDLALPEASALLQAAYGVTGRVQTMRRDLDVRTVPSASALYALTIMVLAQRVRGLDRAIYRYRPDAHTLDAVAACPTVEDTARIFLDQPYVADASMVVMCVANPEKPIESYMERGYRFLLIEAGHVVQNLALTSAAMGLGCCPVGGFEDFRLGSVAGLDPQQAWPLYGAAVGVPTRDTGVDHREPAGLFADD